MTETACHLHVHTDASIRDGLGVVPRLVKRAKEMGFPHLAMTDHGTLANAVSFTIEAQEVGIKPILGLEGYIAFDGKIGHITLLADGNSGWSNLVKLNNLAHQSTYKQPAFTIDQLVAHADGLVCLTGCMASPIHQLNPGDALNLVAKLKGHFGSRLFAEMMFNSGADSFSRPMWIAEKLGLSLVISNDVHFPESSDGEVHRDLTLMKAGFDYDSSELYLKSGEQVIAAAVDAGVDLEVATDAWNRTGKIAELLGEVKLQKEPTLPHVSNAQIIDMLEEIQNSSRMVSAPEYESRVQYELDVIGKMGYLSYFYILNDIVSYARSIGVPVGPGRGSGAGSLVLYLMGITDIDPIKHGLQFERFLNPERRGMPDVDVDFGTFSREQALDYAARKWGAIPIATYSRWSHKSLTRDLGRHFRIDKKIVDEAADQGPNSDAFAQMIEDEPKVEACYEAFNGQIRHKGKHAGGVIITDVEVPVERVSDTLAASWTEGSHNELSYAGVVKFDLLGLAALSAIKLMEEYTGEKAPEPEDDSEVFEIFKRGDLSGIFQFAGSDGIRTLTMRLEPNTFEDLVAINALYRPGAMDAGSTELYPDWKKSPRKVPAYIEDILEDTYGAIVFQEQFMAIYARTVDGGLGEADTARRIITKSKPGDPRWVRKAKEIEENFLAGAERHGLSKKEAKQLWSELATHSRYSFNKSHSAAYSVVSWRMAWFKYYHPVAFYTAMMNVDPTQAQTYIMDAVRAGIDFSPPHVNFSSTNYEFDKRTIFMPFTSIKFMGLSAAEALVAERDENGPFDSLENFMNRVPKSVVRVRAREGLLMTGGFHDLFLPKENWKTLAIKKEPEAMTDRERQLKHFGVVLPSPSLLGNIDKYEKMGWTCGVVDKVEARDKGRGPYWVHWLSPSGVFWTNKFELTKGDVVAVKIDDKSGRCQRMAQL